VSFIGTLEAVRHRLEGNPFDSVPSLVDALQSRVGGVSRLAGLEGHASVAAALKRTSFARAAGMEVPVYWAGLEGREFKRIYPSLTYDIVGTNPRMDAGFVFQSPSYRGDNYLVPEPLATEALTDVDADEDLGEYPRAARRREVEHPLDVLVELRAYATNPILLAMLEVHVLTRVFLPRHFLRVPQQDGSYRSWDVLYQDSKDLDQRQAVRAGTPGVEREYGKSWTWKVEGYFDNTDTARLVSLVRERRLDMGTTA
jgi:hypothetical protein